MSDHEARIVVMGATNRPFALDQAILRRMPKRYKIDMPKLPQRRHILTLVSQYFYHR
jgi:SpoVK/Ycf46/Vps4 family AAA+-type ATPase